MPDYAPTAVEADPVVPERPERIPAGPLLLSVLNGSAVGATTTYYAAGTVGVIALGATTATAGVVRTAYAFRKVSRHHGYGGFGRWGWGGGYGYGGFGGRWRRYGAAGRAAGYSPTGSASTGGTWSARRGGRWGGGWRSTSGSASSAGPYGAAGATGGRPAHTRRGLLGRIRQGETAMATPVAGAADSPATTTPARAGWRARRAAAAAARTGTAPATASPSATAPATASSAGGRPATGRGRFGGRLSGRRTAGSPLGTGTGTASGLGTHTGRTGRLGGLLGRAGRPGAGRTAGATTGPGTARQTTQAATRRAAPVGARIRKAAGAVQTGVPTATRRAGEGIARWWRSGAEGRRLMRQHARMTRRIGGTLILATAAGILGKLTRPFTWGSGKSAALRVWNWRARRACAKETAIDAKVAAQKAAAARPHVKAQVNDPKRAAAPSKPAAPTTPSNGAPMQVFAKAAEAVANAYTTYSPPSMMAVAAEYEGVPEGIRSAAMAIRHLAVQTQTVYPAHMPVVEAVSDVYKAMLDAATTADEVAPTFRKVHAEDIARHEAPRNGWSGEAMWNIAGRAGDGGTTYQSVFAQSCEQVATVYSTFAPTSVRAGGTVVSGLGVGVSVAAEAGGAPVASGGRSGWAGAAGAGAAVGGWGRGREVCTPARPAPVVRSWGRVAAAWVGPARRSRTGMP
ncbi:hypothetical protein [Streptomyces mobaraensis]|uniref:hypothetical protein n=1 Tax=Streptomyces mobaraensis TaxID=35621 RepID=UPI001FA70067|nr:hypothetical protein [Streptomyces mobaraensis]